MKKEEFEAQMEQFNIIVRLGDFSNNNSGPNPIPTGLLKDLLTIDPPKLADLIIFGFHALAIAEELYTKAAKLDQKQTRPLSEAIQAIVIFDKVDTFIRALPCLAEVYGQFGFDLRGDIAEAIPLEKTLVHTVRNLVEEHKLNGRIAKQALERSERRQQTRIFPWVRDLLVHYQPAAYKPS